MGSQAVVKFRHELVQIRGRSGVCKLIELTFEQLKKSGDVCVWWVGRDRCLVGIGRDRGGQAGHLQWIFFSFPKCN